MRVFLIFLTDLILIPFVYILAYSLKFKLGILFNFIFESTEGKIYHHAQIEPYLSSIFLFSTLMKISMLINTFTSSQHLFSFFLNFN